MILKNLRCQNSKCNKLLGKVDENNILHVDSERKAWNIKIEMKKGSVICKKCGTKVIWK